jgi:hypothetical protein
MLDRHRRRLPERERRRRKHQKRGGAARFRHPGDPRGFKAAVGPYAVHDRQPAADLVLRYVEDTALFVEGAGGNLGRMSVDGDGRKAWRRCHVAQVLAEAPSSIVRSSANGSRTAGMTPCGT